MKGESVEDTTSVIEIIDERASFCITNLDLNTAQKQQK